MSRIAATAGADRPAVGPRMSRVEVMTSADKPARSRRAVALG
ncbi:hypothetical protein [Paractinoplanes durhamensis]|nr:hypothetical protein [Actinoplanes durhamensis]